MMNIFEEWLEIYFEEMTPFEFYREVFPPGELQNKGEYTKGKYNAIAVEVTKEKKKNGKPKILRHTITDDLEKINELCESDNFCLCSPISYCGKERTASHSRFCYAIAVDLDKIRIVDGNPNGLLNLWNGHIEGVERIPKPTMIVSSGTGLHLYYVFEEPIPLFQNTTKQLQKYKHELTRLIWHDSITSIKDEREIQQEGIFQGFRMPGTVTKNGERTRAFETGRKVTIEYLNRFVDDEYQVNRYTVKKDMTLSKAKEQFPEWYERRIVKKEPKGVWHISRNLYDWWKREILKKATVGHRYYCLMMLSLYAQKCSMYDPKHNPNPVTYDELEKDCFEIMEYFETLTDSDDNHFDESDVQDALESFNEKYITYPRNSVEYKSGIAIKENKRNGQKQEWHLEDCRMLKANMKRRGRAFKHPEGRPDKRKVVQEWQATHPEGRKADCIRDTGLSKPTVLKHWHDIK